MPSTLRSRCAVGAFLDSASCSTFVVGLGTRFQAFGGRRLNGATVDGLGRGSEAPPHILAATHGWRGIKCDGGSMTFPAVVFLE
jgi:hypothetical protein